MEFVRCRIAAETQRKISPVSENIEKVIIYVKKVIIKVIIYVKKVIIYVNILKYNFLYGLVFLYFIGSYLNNSIIVNSWLGNCSIYNCIKKN